MLKRHTSYMGPCEYCAMLTRCRHEASYANYCQQLYEVYACGRMHVESSNWAVNLFIFFEIAKEMEYFSSNNTITESTAAAIARKTKTPSMSSSLIQ